MFINEWDIKVIAIHFSVLFYQVYDGLDFRRNMQVVNKTGYSTELYTAEAKTIIDAHNTSEVG